MLFVHVTEKCKDDAERSGIKAQLDRLVADVEKRQTTSAFDQFPRPYFVKKKFAGRQGRLIAAEKIVTHAGVTHNVLVFLTILIRGSNEYDGPSGFGHNPEEYGNRNLIPMLNKIDCEAIVAERLRNDPPQSKNILSELERAFLENANYAGDASEDRMLCESKKWVDEVVKCEDLLPRLKDQINEVLDLGWDESMGGSPMLEKVKEREDYSIAYQWLERGRRLFLYDLVHGDDEPDGAIPKNRHDQVQKYFYREYPDWMLLDDKMWIDLEKDRFGNFSLSPEESRILHPEDKQLKFPLFINGRAGSGKSTVLQYIYAEYLSRYAKFEPNTGKPPAYFACNRELIHTAADLVRSILLNNPRYCDCEHKDAIKAFVNNEEAFGKSFHVYHEYLLSLVDSRDRAKLFPERRYLDYARFTKKWEEKFSRTQNARRDYGVDISWHVIRTYIKGMSMDGFLELSDYRGIPESQQSVSEDEFKTVFKNVWEAWYQELTDQENGDGYWDDQDLVRYILDKDMLPREGQGFLGVFCDESQDFTHIELESFLRMSVYFERLIYPYEISKLPFVFAGDPYQTLNPTGFRWEAVKAAFTEKFVFGICPVADKVQTDYFTLSDLQNNYRSIPNIVRFGNSVQMLRGAKFQIPDLKPQLEWKSDVARPISYFPASDEHFWTEMRNREGVHIIVPCHANEEFQFIENDAVLRKYVSVDKKNGTTHPPVFSAVRAKGLEFPCVIVYGFGQSLRDQKLIDIKDTVTEADRARYLPYEYFLNRLYVAVSRPRSQLYIVDTDQGRKNLWRFAESSTVLKEIQNVVPHGQVWSEHIESFQEGTAEHLDSDFEYNPEELAERFEKNGLAENDPVMMSYAARYYQECGEKNEKVAECEAMAMLFKKDYAGAAKRFTDIRNYSRAGDCWWENGSKDGWSAMEKLSSHDPKLLTDPKYPVAKVLANGDQKTAIRVLDNLLKKIDEAGVEQFQSEKWVRAVTAVVKLAVSDSANIKDSTREFILRLVEIGVCEPSEKFAEAMLESGDVKRARRLYEFSGVNKGDRYQQTMFATTEYPACLSYFNAEDSEIRKQTIDLYQRNANVELSENAWRSAVSTAFVKEGRIEDAIDIIAGISDPTILRTLATIASDASWKTRLRNAAEIMHLRAQPLENIAQAVLANFEKNADVWLWLRVLARITATKNGKIEDRTVEQLSAHVRKIYLRWRQAPFNDEERERIVPAGEFGIVLEKYVTARDAAGFYKWNYSITKNAHVAARWLELRTQELKRMHGSEAANVRAEIEKFANETGINPNSRHTQSALFEFGWDSLLKTFFTKPDTDKADRHVNRVTSEKGTELQDPPRKTEDIQEVESHPEAKAETRSGEDEVGATALKLTFFSAKQRLNIEDQESGSQWTITNKGLSVDGEMKGHVSKIKIEGTNFHVSTSPSQVVLSDDRCGYEFTIKLDKGVRT